MNSHGFNDNPDPECSYASFVTTRKTYSVKRSNEGDRENTCHDSDTCLAEGTNGESRIEETSVASKNHGTSKDGAESRGIGMLSCEPPRSEETVDVSAPTTEYADPKDIHCFGIKETCNRYTNTGMGKETLTVGSVYSTAKEMGHKGSTIPNLEKLDGITCKSIDAIKPYESGRYYKTDTEEGAYKTH